MNAKAKIGELLLMLGIGLSVGGAVGYVSGHLPAEHLPSRKIHHFYYFRDMGYFSGW